MAKCLQHYMLIKYTNKNDIMNTLCFLASKHLCCEKHIGTKRRCKRGSRVFFIFSFFLLFYSRKNIKHSENIFHILRAIQNVLHGFSS